MTGKERRLIEQQVYAKWSTHPLYEYRYAKGSRRVCDFLISIAEYTAKGDLTEAAYWKRELATLVPEFSE